MLNVIGAGFGRTGTTSLKAALETLGLGPCHHMTEVLDQPGQIEAWARVAHGGPADWDGLLRGYRSTLDWPAARFWRELAARHPEAKIILTERDPDAWYESTLATIYRIAQEKPAGAVGEDMYAMLNALVWDGVFGGRFEDREYAIEVFLRSNETVKREVPEDRLLVYRAGDGWEPLCSFLGLPIPEESYPHLNDRAAMLARVAGMAEGS
ncbi:hypothetical protein BTM25_39200 [Actinomadura rubteroloni]|uniref:Sulfotransferase family protein n=1 Tax=Actinomadura rubteroloni TaxID=1926885 RepID=A0A2P4UJS2_9ACTN|nr:sulfotransferase family protein [Actinomadura rubteroloni]POM25276.1 hypothetical protein BTM25_39200 [Actinomadura rubteroloni]